MAPVMPAESTERPSSRLLVAAVAGLLALSIGLQIVRDRGWQPYQPTTPMLWFQSGPLLKRVALGFDNVIADIYWMRARSCITVATGERTTRTATSTCSIPC